MNTDQAIDALQYQAQLCERDAARDFKEAGLLGGIAAAATLLGSELAEKLPSDLVSETTAKTILVVGSVASATVLVAGVTAGYLRKREAKLFYKEAEELANTQQ